LRAELRAELRVGEALSLYNQAEEECGPGGRADALALLRRSWVVLLAQAMPIIQGCMGKGTLLPGKLRKVDEAVEVYQMTTGRVSEVSGLTLQGEQARRLRASAFGLEAALFAAILALDVLQLPLGSADQRSRAQAFVLAALRHPRNGGAPGCGAQRAVTCRQD
jgi:hypothetical protein